MRLSNCVFIMPVFIEMLFLNMQEKLVISYCKVITGY